MLFTSVVLAQVVTPRSKGHRSYQNINITNGRSISSMWVIKKHQDLKYTQRESGLWEAVNITSLYTNYQY